MTEWDPIGVSDVPGAIDEYDSYIVHAYQMLMDDDAAVAQIADYLWWAATANMGLTPHDDLRVRCDKAAERLVAMKCGFEAD